MGVLSNLGKMLFMGCPTDRQSYSVLQLHPTLLSAPPRCPAAAIWNPWVLDVRLRWKCFSTDIKCCLWVARQTVNYIGVLRVHTTLLYVPPRCPAAAIWTPWTMGT